MRRRDEESKGARSMTTNLDEMTRKIVKTLQVMRQENLNPSDEGDFQAVREVFTRIAERIPTADRFKAVRPLQVLIDTVIDAPDLSQTKDAPVEVARILEQLRGMQDEEAAGQFEVTVDDFSIDEGAGADIIDLLPDGEGSYEPPVIKAGPRVVSEDPISYHHFKYVGTVAVLDRGDGTCNIGFSVIDAADRLVSFNRKKGREIASGRAKTIRTPRYDKNGVLRIPIALEAVEKEYAERFIQTARMMYDNLGWDHVVLFFDRIVARFWGEQGYESDFFTAVKGSFKGSKIPVGQPHILSQKNGDTVGDDIMF